MKLKQISAVFLAMLILSSCAYKTPDEPIGDGQVTTSAETTTLPEEVTTSDSPQTTSPESEAIPEEEVTESEIPSEEEVTEATTISEEVTEAETIPTEAPEEAEPLRGVTTEGDEFDIDSDYAYFLVNRDIPLPDDYSIETDYIQGSYELEVTAAYYCRQMIEAAANDGIDLKILSAYRTVKYQQKLFDRNVKSRMESGMTYDEAYADVLINIAIPGTSEHNAGLAVDIVTTHDWDTYEGFEDTEEFAWLQEHAHEYGFILRYLKGKEDITGYIYEPWHYRFIGVKYALDIKESGLCLEEYFDIHPQAY